MIDVDMHPVNYLLAFPSIPVVFSYFERPVQVMQALYFPDNLNWQLKTT